MILKVFRYYFLLNITFVFQQKKIRPKITVLQMFKPNRICGLVLEIQNFTFLGLISCVILRITDMVGVNSMDSNVRNDAVLVLRVSKRCRFNSSSYVGFFFTTFPPQYLLLLIFNRLPLFIFDFIFSSYLFARFVSFPVFSLYLLLASGFVAQVSWYYLFLLTRYVSFLLLYRFVSICCTGFRYTFFIFFFIPVLLYRLVPEDVMFFLFLFQTFSIFYLCSASFRFCFTGLLLKASDILCRGLRNMKVCFMPFSTHILLTS
ncbi:hypothetical protein LXL04_013375 [Taraxacum kok-saghyz]